MSTVTILLATYNGERYLAEQLDSLLLQTYTDWKVIIHDDNSSDSTINIIKKYETKYPKKIQFINDNIGWGSASANFSYLLEHTDTEYIMFCDQDDIWLPNKIELTLQKMKNVEKTHRNTPILIHTDLKVVNHNLDILSDSYWSYQGINPSCDTLNRLLVQNVITGCTVMINKQLAAIALPIPKNVIMHDWWLGLVASAFGKIHHINTVTMLYRQHGSNDTGATSFNMKTILKKAKNLTLIDMRKYIRQAEAFLSRYEKHLRTEQKELLKAFVATKDQSWITSKQILLKYKILKQDLFRNIGLLLCR